MIPGAIDSSRFERRPRHDNIDTIVIYCTIGLRSGLYAEELRRKGHAVRNLRGGILAWVHAGQDVVKGGRPTRRLHVYGPKWDLLPDGHVAVW